MEGWGRWREVEGQDQMRVGRIHPYAARPGADGQDLLHGVKGQGGGLVRETMAHRLQAQKHRDTRGRRIKQEKHLRLSMVFSDIIRRSLSYFEKPGAHFGASLKFCCLFSK